VSAALPAKAQSSDEFIEAPEIIRALTPTKLTGFRMTLASGQKILK
jgi:hypothetical protein